uniref:Uncharacterized protein n=1 Tax=Rhizophora mucronata TaxID=61149 RepID=A0A2P2QFW7_RHIMU
MESLPAAISKDRLL